MKNLFPHCEPFPASAVGARLCQTFNYTWNAILKANDALGNWQTVTKYPLKPRVLWRLHQDVGSLVGVRFDDTTQYALIDIDIQSLYHPQQSADGIKRVLAALETMGICRTFCTRSSWSNGIHLWIPLAASVPSFWLATALKGCLESHSLKVAQGQLETFPNCKSYAKVGEFSDYQGHRLPLQPASGAVLLNEDMEAIPGGLSEFFARWNWAATGQDLTLLTAAIALAKALRSHRRYRTASAVMAEWRRDLETEMTEGWTGHGQTNHLLKTIACYGVVFAAQSGIQLEQYILTTVEQLPGYYQWCRHQSEIKARAHAWAKMADGYYWALGTQGTRSTTFYQPLSDDVAVGNGNEKRAAEARQRIQAAVESLEAAHNLPDGIRHRMHLLARTAKCSNQTLQKVKALWHPDYRLLSSQPQKPSEEAPGGSVCNTTGEGDPGKKPPLKTKQPDPQNTEQMAMLHTVAQPMKGCNAFVVLSGEPPKKLLSPLLQWENRSDKRELYPRLKELRLDQADGLQSQNCTTAPNTRESLTATVALSPAVYALSQVDALAVAKHTALATPQTTATTASVLSPSTTAKLELSKARLHNARGVPKVDRAIPLTPLDALLARFTTAVGQKARAPQTTNWVSDQLATAQSGMSNGNTVRLPSDPPEAVRLLTTHETTVSQRPRPRKPPKPAVDSTTLQPNVIDIVSLPVQFEITPSAVFEVTNAIHVQMKQLQAEHQWTAATLQTWIAQHFDGRRRSDFKDSELPLLLEKLHHHWQTLHTEHTDQETSRELPRSE